MTPSALSGGQFTAGAAKRKTRTNEAQTPAPAKKARLANARPLEPVAERLPVHEERAVTLKYFSPDAREVQVAGNFNDWQPQATPLKKAGDAEWCVELSLHPGIYEYRFVVDGHWCEDPLAASRGANPYGGCNSILIVPRPDQTSNL